MNSSHMPELDWSFGYPLVLRRWRGSPLFLVSLQEGGWI